MVVIAMGNENQVNGRKLVERNARSLEAGDEKRDGIRIDRVGKDIEAINLDQNGSVIDERNRASHRALGRFRPQEG